MQQNCLRPTLSDCVPPTPYTWVDLLVPTYWGCYPAHPLTAQHLLPRGLTGPDLLRLPSSSPTYSTPLTATPKYKMSPHITAPKCTPQLWLIVATPQLPANFPTYTISPLTQLLPPMTHTCNNISHLVWLMGPPHQPTCVWPQPHSASWCSDWTCRYPSSLYFSSCAPLGTTLCANSLWPS